MSVEKKPPSTPAALVGSPDQLLSLLRRDRAGFFAKKVHFRHWVRGGDPGEGYTSDLFEILGDPAAPPGQSRGFVSAYVRTRFDLGYEPPFLAERFEAPTDPADVAALLDAVLESVIFRRSDPSEQSNVADVLKETWLLRRGNEEVAKTFHEPFPKGIATLRSIVSAKAEVLSRLVAPRILNKRRGEG